VALAGRGMIEQLLPSGVAVGETLTELPEPLFPEEEAAVARAVAKRRDEFRSVRACARTALAQLGLERQAMVPGVRGAPPWPPGVVGSLTHCAGYRAAAVTRVDRLASLGIDGEPHAPLPDGVIRIVSLPEEREELSRLARDRPDVCWDRLLFSAKESIYKAWFPLAGTWLGFEDARLTVDPVAGTFSADLLVTGPTVGDRPLTGVRGRWLVRRGLVLTAVTVPAGDVG